LAAGIVCRAFVPSDQADEAEERADDGPEGGEEEEGQPARDDVGAVADVGVVGVEDGDDVGGEAEFDDGEGEAGDEEDEDRQVGGEHCGVFGGSKRVLWGSAKASGLCFLFTRSRRIGMRTNLCWPFPRPSLTYLLVFRWWARPRHTHPWQPLCPIVVKQVTHVVIPFPACQVNSLSGLANERSLWRPMCRLVKRPERSALTATARLSLGVDVPERDICSLISGLARLRWRLRGRRASIIRQIRSS
jgi:hypothetical protein